MRRRVGITQVLGGSPSLFGTQFQQGTFSLGTDERYLARFLVSLFEGSRVQGDRHVDQVGEFVRDVILEIGEVQGRSHVISCESFLVGGFITGRSVDSSWVLGNVSNDLSVDKRGADDGHVVGGQSTGLVGANNRSRSHGFTTGEHSDQQVLFCHSLGSKGQGESDGERKTFGDGDDNQGNGNNQDLDETLTLFVGSPSGLGLELNQESNHQGEEKLEGGGGSAMPIFEVLKTHKTTGRGTKSSNEFR